MRLVAPQVQVQAGCTRRDSHNPEVARDLRVENPGAVHAVGERAGVDQQPHEVVELVPETLQMQHQLLATPDGEVALHAAERHGAAQETRAEKALLDPDEALAEGLRAARGHGEGHVRRDGADVRDVVVDALELQEHDAEVASPRRGLDAREPLDRVGVGEGVTHGCVAGDRLGQEQPVAPRQPLEALLGALVHVEEPQLEIENRLTGDAEPEMAWLDDARVDRPHREMEDALAGHRTIGPELPSHARHGLPLVEVLPQRPSALRPIVVEGDPILIRVSVGRQAEIVHDFPLEPVGDRVLGRDRWKARSAGRDRRPYAHECGRLGRGPLVMDREALPRPLVRAEEGGEAKTCRSRAVGNNRELGKIDLGDELPRSHLGERIESQPYPQHVAGGAHCPPSTTRTAAWIRSRRSGGR